MRPYILCHMLSSVDGKIDGAALRAVTANGEYEAIGTKLEGDAWVCGRTTMEQHFAEDKPFVSVSNRPIANGPVGISASIRSLHQHRHPLLRLAGPPSHPVSRISGAR